MINSIVDEFVKLREKDQFTKKSIKDMIDSLKTELVSLDEKLEKARTEMTVYFN